MAGPVPVATVLGCDPVSHKLCAVVERGRSRIRYENMREKYSPIIISVKQTLQTSQTIIAATQQTNLLIWVEFPGCYRYKICMGTSHIILTNSYDIIIISPPLLARILQQ